MDMLGLIVVAIAFVAVLPAVREQYRRDPAGFWRTLRLLGLYLAYVAAGIGVVVGLLSGPPPGAARSVAAFVFIMAYVFYGAVWLGRTVPRYRELPAWFDRFPGALDYVFWALLAASLAYCLLA